MGGVSTKQVFDVPTHMVGTLKGTFNNIIPDLKERISVYTEKHYSDSATFTRFNKTNNSVASKG